MRNSRRLWARANISALTWTRLGMSPAKCDSSNIDVLCADLFYCSRSYKVQGTAIHHFRLFSHSIQFEIEVDPVYYLNAFSWSYCSWFVSICCSKKVFLQKSITIFYFSNDVILLCFLTLFIFWNRKTVFYTKKRKKWKHLTIQLANAL